MRRAGGRSRWAEQVRGALHGRRCAALQTRQAGCDAMRCARRAAGAQCDALMITVLGRFDTYKGGVKVYEAYEVKKKSEKLRCLLLRCIFV